MYRDTYASIDLDAIKKNVKNSIKFLSEGTQLIAVVKSNAYGHGAVEASFAALEAGASFLAVAQSEEALHLRKNGIKAPVMVLGVSNESQMQLALENDVQLCIASIEEYDILSKIAAEKQVCAKIHIKIDTGMGRIGFDCLRKYKSVLNKIKKDSFVEFYGLFSHLSCADMKDTSFTKKQVARFEQFRQAAFDMGFSPICHLSNSAAIVSDQNLNYDMVRLGISLYGYYASDEVTSENVELYPAMSVHSSIVFVKKVKKGTSISYGATYVADEEKIIATMPIGYGDGYNRLLSNKGRVIVISGGKSYYANIVGRVCMDQTMLDVSHIPDIKVGDEVIVLGSYEDKKIDADEIADICGTISYEILLSFSSRVPRVYK